MCVCLALEILSTKDMQDFIEQFKINIENLTYRRKYARIPLNNLKVLGYYI
jgi:hypothetical protein